jgi:hypothetical protein
MPNLLDVIKGPFAGVLDAANAIIGKFVTSPEQKAAAQLELAQLYSQQTLKLAELDAQVAATQATVITAEVNSQSWLARNWRPLMMLFFAVIIASVVWTGGYVNGHELDHAVVMRILDIIYLGLGGYVFGRSAEKIVPDTASAIATAVTATRGAK